MSKEAPVHLEPSWVTSPCPVWCRFKDAERDEWGVKHAYYGPYPLGYDEDPRNPEHESEHITLYDMEPGFTEDHMQERRLSHELYLVKRLDRPMQVVTHGDGDCADNLGGLGAGFDGLMQFADQLEAAAATLRRLAHDHTAELCELVTPK